MSHIVDSLVAEGLTDSGSVRVQATVVATANTTTTLSVGSVSYMIFTGSTSGQIVRLGDATTYLVGHTYLIHNASTATVSIEDNSGSTLFTLSAGQRSVVILQNNSTAAGIWVYTLTTPVISGGGTVTSVALSLPSIFSVSGSPVTTSGTLTGSLVNQNANTIFAGPASGAAAVPTFRTQVLADLPQLTNGQLYIGSTGASVVASTLTAGTGISITNGAGSITIASTVTGTVTSVALALPSIFTVSGSPVTTSGTLTGTFNTQTANTVFAGPSTGSPAVPTFRSLVLADLPQLTNGQLYIGSTGSSVVASTLTAGTGISITNGAGSITIATTLTGTGLRSKAGTITAGTFTGTPRTASVTFTSAFPDTNYTITVTGVDARQWSWSSKATTGFTISSNANQALTGNVDWQAIAIGEST